MASKIAFEVEIKNLKKITELKDELARLRKQQKLLEQEQKKNTQGGKIAAAQYAKNAKAIGEKSKQLRGLNKALRDGDKATKAQAKSTNSLSASFIKASAQLGILVTAYRTVNRMVTAVISTFSEFEFTLAKVRAVSGATDEEFAGLSKTAEDLGRSTFFTAAQVAGLQLNFAKLGFRTDEIQDATEATLQLATATGSDLERAATVAGNTVRGFALDASETQRVVDVMAAAFTGSALDIEKFATSMSKVAPVAKAAGFSLEETAAILGIVQTAGIEASIAGTSLRNIFLKMQDPTSDFVKNIGFTIQGLDEMIPAMQKFSASGGDVAEMLGLIDVRQAPTFLNILNGTENVAQFARELRNSEGAGARMAAIIGDTLQGAFLKFTSALQGVYIKVMQQYGNSLKETVVNIAEFLNKLAENEKRLKFVTKSLGILIRSIALFKAGQIAANLAVSLGRGVMSLYAIAVSRTTIAVKGLNTSLSFTRKALARTGIGLAAVLIGNLAASFMKTKEEADGAGEEVDDFTKELDKLNQLQEDVDTMVFSALGQTIKEANQNITNLKKEQEKYVQVLKDNENGVIELSFAEKKAYEDALRRLTERIQFERENIDAIKEQNRLGNDLIEKKKKEIEVAKLLPATTREELKLRNQTLDTLQKELEALLALGIEKEKQKEKEFDELDPSFISQNIKEYETALLNSGKNVKDIRAELAQFEIELIQAVLKDEMLSYDTRVDLENKLANLKRQNGEQTIKDINDNRKLIGEYRKVGSALTNLAGENEKLNALREAGNAITKAAGIVESILTIRKTAAAIAEGKLSLATLFGTKAKLANTKATVAQTAVETASIAPKVASGAAGTKFVPLNFNT